MRRIFEENREELKNTKWLAELAKGCVISLITIAVLFFLRQYSSGNKSGEDLKLYLAEQLCKTIGIKSMDSASIITPYSGIYETVSDKDVLVTYGQYTLDKNNSGRVIALFERKKESLLNQIIGSPPSHSVSFIRNIEFEEVDPSSFCYTDIDVRDIDSDGNSEIFLSLQTNFASRISHTELLISRINGKWKIISPDSELMTKIQMSAEESGYKIYYDEFILTNPNKRDEMDAVQGLSHNGLVYIVKNPLSGETNLCYEIAANDGSVGSSVNSHYVYVMLRLKNGELTIDDNWNGGEILILKEDKNFLEEIDSYWGYRIGENLRFYSSPE